MKKLDSIHHLWWKWFYLLESHRNWRRLIFFSLFSSECRASFSAFSRVTTTIDKEIRIIYSAFPSDQRWFCIKLSIWKGNCQTNKKGWKFLQGKTNNVFIARRLCDFYFYCRAFLFVICKKYTPKDVGRCWNICKTVLIDKWTVDTFFFSKAGKCSFMRIFHDIDDIHKWY